MRRDLVALFERAERRWRGGAIYAPLPPLPKRRGGWKQPWCRVPVFLRDNLVEPEKPKRRRVSLRALNPIERAAEDAKKAAQYARMVVKNRQHSIARAIARAEEQARRQQAVYHAMLARTKWAADLAAGWTADECGICPRCTIKRMRVVILVQDVGGVCVWCAAELAVAGAQVATR